jgi:class 3 adenylate cyclase/tetratricopeptide (TPR) repeat protein
MLVRREDQLAILEEALLAANRGEGRVVVVSGEAGIGKTRLVTELSHEARRLGSSVLWGGCSEAELSLPYLPFVEAIGNRLSVEEIASFAPRLGSSRPVLAQLFPQLSEGEAPEKGTDPAQSKLRLFEAIVSLLTVVAENQSLLLVIEDVHWADESTRELLDHLARRLTGLPVLVLVTFRSDELHRRHPLQPTLHAWRRSGVAEIVDLEPLSAAGIEEMVAAILGTAEVDRDLSALLYGRSEGNPFVLEEMLRETADEIDDPRSLNRKAFERIQIPDTVRDTILLRLARLDPEQVTILEAAAVLGRSFDYPMLVAVAGAGDTAVHSALETGIAEQLIEEDPGRTGHYQWRHALTQEAIYTEIVTPRRQAIHASAADVLSASEGTRPVDLANHLLGAGRFEDAVPVCMESAAEAERAVAFGEAISLLERALPHLTDPLERARLICRIGQDHWLNGESAAGAGFLAEGIASLDELGERLDAARARVVLGRCLWEGEKPAEARAEYVQARDVLEVEGPSAELAMAHMRLAGLDAFELDYQGCLEHSRRAVQIAEQAGADYERVWALGFLSLGLLDSGEHERGFQVMDECYAEAVRKGYWIIAGNMTFNDVWTRTHMLQGGLEERLQRFDEMPGMRANRASKAILTSYVALARGNLAEALDCARGSLELYEDLGYGKMIWRCRVQLAAVLAELGRYSEAGEVLPATSNRTELQDIVYDAAAQIRLRLGRGEIDPALELAREIAREAEGGLATYREVFALVAEALIAGGDLNGAEALVDAMSSRGTNPGMSYADELRGRVLLARGEAAAAKPLLADAVKAAEEVGYPLVALRRRVLRAEALGGMGDADGAKRELGAVAAEVDDRRAALLRSEAEAASERLGVPLPPDDLKSVADEEPEYAQVPMGERLVTSLFADVRGYTQLAGSVPPEELTDRMTALYRFARAAVARNHGIIDKFAGDAVMATFNATGTRVQHATDALEAALSLRDKAQLIDLDLGIGIAVGPAVLSSGASDANVSVRGESTNLASRLQGAAAGGEILLSEEAHRRVERRLKDLDLHAAGEELEIKGVSRSVPAFRIGAPVTAGT